MFMPCRATHRADSRPPAPHQIRSDSPSERGWTGSSPSIPVCAGSACATPSPAIARRNSSVCARASSAPASPWASETERFRAVEHGLRRAAADPQLQPAAGDQIGRARVFGHVERVLVAHVDDRGSQLDPARARAHRGQQRERRAELAREVVHAHERPVDPDLLRRLRQLDRLDERVFRGRRPRPLGALPVAEAQKADPQLLARADRHQDSLPDTAIRPRISTSRPRRPSLSGFPTGPARRRRRSAGGP